MPPKASARSAAITPSATVGIADAVSELRREGVDVVDFSAGRAAEAAPESVVRAASDAMSKGDTHQTMARGTTAFRAACALKLERENGLTADPEREVIATLGCKQGLYLALLATLDPGDEVLVEDPGFVSYQPEVAYAGGTAVAVSLPWSHERLSAAVSERTRGLVMCAPHNPTGRVRTEQELDVIARVASERDLIVYSDETYERLTWTGHAHVSIATRPGMRERTVSLMGLTKSYSMGGFRIGFAHASEWIVDAMNTVQQHLITCASSIAQAAGAHAYETPAGDEVRARWKDWEARCRHAVETLNAFPGVSCEMPEGGFYAWMDVSKLGESSESLASRLLDEARVAVVPGSAFGPSGAGFLRATCVRSWPELERGLARMRGVLC